MTVNDLSHVNAGLNATAMVLIVAGYAMIRRKRVAAHKACMLSATAVSAAFLVSYLIYHYFAGHVSFAGQGAIRVVYGVILVTHIILAAVTPALVIVTLYRALRNQIDKHRRFARWTLPIWLYVSFTGVAVYLMLYVIYSGGGE